MKCSIKSLLALMVGAVMLESCNDSDFFETKSGAAKTGNMSFTATVDGAESRASFSEDSLLFMKPNNEISVFSFGHNNKFTMNDEGRFVGNCEDSDKYYAISPYSENHQVRVGENGDLIIIEWNGIEQVVDLPGNSAPMVAHVKNAGEGAQNVPLIFQHLCAFIKFTTDYPCKSITLKPRGVEKLAAKNICLEYDVNGLLRTHYLGTRQAITLTGKDGGNIEAGTYYIPVVPGKLSKGIDITFTNIYKEKTYTMSLSNKLSLVCSETVDLGTLNIKSEMVHLAGNGTEADPYLIHDFDQLVEMRDFVTNSTGGGDCYKLVDDIDCQGREMSPIGNFKHMFCGTFDGGNHCIKNLYIKGSMEYIIPDSFFISETSRVCALFTAIKGATIKKLTIDSPSFNLDYNGEKVTVSPFVGVTYCDDADYDESRCRILNCKLTGDCSVNQTCDKKNTSFIGAFGFVYGGFVGCNQSNLEVTDCSMDMSLNTSYLGELSGKLSCVVGGYIGLTYGANTENSSDLSHHGKVRINNCRNNSPNMFVKYENSKKSRAYIGGFIGHVFNLHSNDVTCFFENCVNNAPISVYGVCAEVNLGGFVGYHHSNGNNRWYYDVPLPRFNAEYPCFKNCVNNGDLNICDCQKDFLLGGFTGYNFNNETDFVNCVNTGILATKIGPFLYGSISYKHGTCTNCYTCAKNYHKIILKDPGKMTNTGHKSIDEVVKIMNASDLVSKKGFSHWRKRTVNGREILDLYTVKGPNIPQ